MKKNLKNLSYWFFSIAMGIILGLSLQIASAWVPPSGDPPEGNVAAPINTGNTSQWRSGKLGIQTGGGLDAGYALSVGSSSYSNDGLKVSGNSYFEDDLSLANGKGITLNGEYRNTWPSVEPGTGTSTNITAGTGIIANPNPITGSGTIGIDSSYVLDTSATGQTKAGGLVLNTGGAPVGMVVMSGKVGIGVAAPAAMLDVSGNLRFRNYSNCTGKLYTDVYGKLLCGVDENTGIKSYATKTGFGPGNSMVCAESVDGANCTKNLGNHSFCFMSGESSWDLAIDSGQLHCMIYPIGTKDASYSGTGKTEWVLEMVTRVGSKNWCSAGCVDLD